LKSQEEAKAAERKKQIDEQERLRAAQGAARKKELQERQRLEAEEKQRKQDLMLQKARDVAERKKKEEEQRKRNEVEAQRQREVQERQAQLEQRRKEAEAKQEAAAKAAEARRREQEEKKAAAAATAEAKRQQIEEQRAAAERARQAQEALQVAKPRATISLFELFGGRDDDEDTEEPSKTLAQPKIVSSAPRGVPVISSWTQGRDGSITGRISGSPNFRDGERVTTSPVSLSAAGGTVVQTSSGSRYESKKETAAMHLCQNYCELSLKILHSFYGMKKVLFGA
jgi:hypothetical protein